MRLAQGVKARPLTRPPHHHFFGYFDKCPWGGQHGGLLLAHETDLVDRPPRSGESIRVGYVDTQNSATFCHVANSHAWNFQQGAMLQWIPGQSDSFVFNDFEGGHLVARVFDIQGNQEQVLARSVAALSPDGKYALSLSFARLARCRPDYGYSGASDPFVDDPCPEEDGIWLVNRSSGRSELLLSLSHVSSFGANANVSGAVHWLNHPLFNPDGTRFCFLHRYRNPAGTIYTRLMTCNVDGSGLRVLLKGLVSHYAWRTTSELLAWCGERKILDSCVRGPLRNLPAGHVSRWAYRALGKPRLLKKRILKDGFWLFDLNANKRQPVGPDVLTCDGHCNFSPDKRWVITDTYADRTGEVCLLLYHWGNGVVTQLAQFRSPPALDDEVRCDLHPRWSQDGTRLCVDSMDDGARQIHELDLTDVVSH